ncbi:MAG: alpha-hydroxy acid oxidase [Acetobacteraceae bacterium]
MSAVNEYVLADSQPSEGAPEAVHPSAIRRPPGRLPSRLRSVLGLEDLEAAARRRLPRFIFGYVEGGVEGNATRAANRGAFAALSFRTRVLVDTTRRSQGATLFGHGYAAPFGIAPMGATILSARDGDLALARAAGAANIPFILSGASLVPLESVIAANPAAWFQAYIPADRAWIGALAERVGRAGFATIVVTADVQVSANRENNVRNGFSLPLRPTPRLVFDALSHPGWLFGTALATFMKSGVPRFENMAATRGVRVLSPDAERLQGRRDALRWADIAWLRQRWPGKLLVKGVLSPEDAHIAQETGLDGIIVSNHGGRQLDFAIASLDALPAVKANAGELAVLLDGGIRRGTDVLKALALGADFVFIGRPFLYAVALGGAAGARHAISLLSEEVDRDLAMLGCSSLAELGPDILAATPGARRT